MKCKKLGGIEVSAAYFGYIKNIDDNNFEIVPVDNETNDKDRIYAVCNIALYDLKNLNGSDFKQNCFGFFDGYESPKGRVKLWPAKRFWRDLMAQTIGNDEIWLISENGKDVFLMHEWKGMVYFLGKVHTGHPLEQACQWRYKRIKTHEG